MLFFSSSLFLFLFFFLIKRIRSNGEAAIIIYSRDNNCNGQEMIRAYTNECKRYYLNDDSTTDFFQFQCLKDSNTLILQQYSDNKCKKSTGNITILIQEEEEDLKFDGSCQQLGKEEINYHSAQLFCGGISAINNPKSFFSTYKTEKIMFKHYTNSDSSCSNKPSVIEMVILFIY